MTSSKDPGYSVFKELVCSCLNQLHLVTYIRMQVLAILSNNAGSVVHTVANVA